MTCREQERAPHPECSGASVCPPSHTARRADRGSGVVSSGQRPASPRPVAAPCGSVGRQLRTEGGHRSGRVRHRPWIRPSGGALDAATATVPPFALQDREERCGEARPGRGDGIGGFDLSLRTSLGATVHRRRAVRGQRSRTAPRTSTRRLGVDRLLASTTSGRWAHRAGRGVEVVRQVEPGGLAGLSRHVAGEHDERPRPGDGLPHARDEQRRQQAREQAAGPQDDQLRLGDRPQRLAGGGDVDGRDPHLVHVARPRDPALPLQLGPSRSRAWSETRSTSPGPRGRGRRAPGSSREPPPRSRRPRAPPGRRAAGCRPRARRGRPTASPGRGTAAPPGRRASPGRCPGTGTGAGGPSAVRRRRGRRCSSGCRPPPGSRARSEGRPTTHRRRRRSPRP